MSAIAVHRQRQRARARRRRVLGAGTREIPVEKILLGGHGRMSGHEFAAVIDDPRWPSRRVIDGPHARLLRAHAVRELDDRDILGSEYGQFARRCLALTGRFYSATDDAGVVRVARDFLLRNSPDAGPVFPRPRESVDRAPIRVSPIRDSDCYQVVDGHHRVAAYAVSGAATVPVRVNLWSVRTPLQEALHAMSRSGRSDELYQPVSSPEVATWPTVRACTDRLEAMERLLEEHGVTAGHTTHLDVASCYGWFVAEMSRRGFRSEGVDPDPLAPTVGAMVGGLDPTQVHTSDAVGFLRGAEQRWDIVSCFSILHHYALGRGAVTPERFVELLDGVTGSVLFLDTGQSHEAWFRRSLPEWDTRHIGSFLAKHTSFDEVIDLGPDRDDRSPYSGNHGRHLFACVRHF